MRRLRIAAVLAVGMALAVSQWATAAPGATRAAPRSHFSPLALESLHLKQRAQSADLNPGDSASQIQCKTNNASGAANLKLDCDTILPNNEPDIAVNPADPMNMVGSSNDYDQCCDAFYTTFNGGKTWYVGDMSVEAPGQNKRTGSDPVTTFDVKNGTVIHSSLNFLNDACDGDVVASISQDGGKKWNTVVQVADAGGPSQCEDDGLFNDKEWITTDNNPESDHYGTSYLVWTAFLSSAGHVLESPIWEAHSTDGGFNWSTPQEISGSNASLCTYQEDGPASECDEDQFGVPTVGPDGTVYVSYVNEQNEGLWESGEVFDDQFLLVKSSNGGGTWSDPVQIAGLEDGSRDFPINVNGRQTLSNQQMRVSSSAGVVADPTLNGRLYFVFSDNRNGTHDVDDPVTNTDVFIVSSVNGGDTWTAPAQVNPADEGAGNDQYYPWVDVNPVDGTVGVLFFDRSYTTHFRPHGTTLAESPAGGAAFAQHEVTTAPSHTRNSVFFRAFAPGCKRCTRFEGDYNNIEYGSDGSVNMVWTDMRDLYAPLGRYLQFIYFARE